MAELPVLYVLAVFSAIVGVCLYGIARIKSPAVHERGHLALSLAPWVHLLVSYAVAFYIRLGFGSWPRSCFDNPDLPMLDGLVTCLVTAVGRRDDKANAHVVASHAWQLRT